MAHATPGTKFKLQPADPFDLIRWLARTQNDPRKAIAELVQNSIDANAQHITIERRRLRGAPALVILDDGDGVLPSLDREAALRYLGTHVGHSHKRGLSPAERHAQVIAGQYGVGLLGFWSIGARLELRSRVAGSDLHVLALHEDRPTATISRLPVELDAPPTFTELVILDLHEASTRPLSGRRLADYLAAELRGPILASGTTIEVHDRLARGLAQKRFTVTPRRFEGMRLDLPAEIAVENHPPIHIELYLSRGADRPTVQLACAGTLVADDLADLAAVLDDFDRPPWRGRDLTGLVDFAGFQVPPGTRRGVIPNAAATAFTRALGRLEPAITAELDRHDRNRRAEADRHLVDDLRKALRGLAERMPQYDLPAIDHGTEQGAGVQGRAVAAVAAATDDLPADEPEAPQVTLFPPGPLATVAIVPHQIQIAPGAERRVAARATDASGRVIRANLTYAWTIDSPSFSIDGDGARPAIAVAGDALPGTEATLQVTVGDGSAMATATATVTAIVERARDRSSAGIPKPVLVDAPAATWRSRMEGPIWQVNAGHEDYAALEDGRARLRYIVSLFGKEIVARTYAQPGAGELLEHLIAVIAHAERNLRG